MPKTNSEHGLPNGCFMPLNAIAVHPQGQIHYCLTSTEKVSQSINDLKKTRIDIHNALLRGEWPTSCLRCFNKEKIGIQSRRTRTWERKSHIYGRNVVESIIQNGKEPTIRHLEISFSNLCNLTCAMCSSEFSTSWIKHDEMAQNNGVNFRGFTEPYRKLNRIPKNLIEEILTHLDTFDLIIIKGGEPTRDPSCLEFLQEVSHRSAHNKKPSVYIQTNGTKPPKEWIYDLKNINLSIGFSMDGWGNTFEWIRGTKFDRVLDHLKEVAGLNFVQSLGIDFTLTAYNCFHLPEFLERIVQLRSEFTKIKSCRVSQWAQEPHASPINLKECDRKIIHDLCQPIFSTEGVFFQNSENISNVLLQPRAKKESIIRANIWLEYINKMRGFRIEDFQKIKNALMLME